MLHSTNPLFLLQLAAEQLENEAKSDFSGNTNENTFEQTNRPQIESISELSARLEEQRPVSPFDLIEKLIQLDAVNRGDEIGSFSPSQSDSGIRHGKKRRRSDSEMESLGLQRLSSVASKGPKTLSTESGAGLQDPPSPLTSEFPSATTEESSTTVLTPESNISLLNVSSSTSAAASEEFPRYLTVSNVGIRAYKKRKGWVELINQEEGAEPLSLTSGSSTPVEVECGRPQESSVGKDFAHGRGRYRCSKCGQPKSNHDCVFAHSGDVRTIGVQVERIYQSSLNHVRAHILPVRDF